MSLAELFLRQFVDASARADVLDYMGENPDGFGEAAEHAPEDFRRALEADASRAPGAPAFINPVAFGSAACDEDGVVLVADTRFRDWLRSTAFLVEDKGKFIAVAAAPLAQARGWPLADDVRACLESGRASIAIVARLPSAPSGGLTRAAQVLGLTGLETRVSAGLIQRGDARGAAEAAGVSYETARAALKDAMRKAGVNRQSAFVSTCMQIESGEAPTTEVAPVMQDLFAITPRQAEVALLIARGASRAEAAAALRLSENIVKSELKAVFTACLVDSVAGLCRVVGQLSALSALAGAVAVDLQLGATTGEPVRLLPRRSGAGRIAFADHGPPSGSATVFLHSGTTGRHLPENYIAALQELGLRPITLDRPGYGLTSPAEGDYLDIAADDIAEIADHLGLTQVNIVCRSGAIVVAHFAKRHSARLGRAVLINPEAPASHDSRYVGFLGGLKRLVTTPETLTALVRTLSRRAAPERILAVVRAAVRHSPADVATLEEPDFQAGFVRASQQAALQEGIGFVALQRCVAEAELAPGETPDDDRFCLLCGAEDGLQATEDAMLWWRRALPNASCELVAGAGRFLHAQRPDLIAAAVLEQRRADGAQSLHP